MSKTPHRISIVQYAGDFREAVERLASGGIETYRAQRYTVEFVEALAQKHASVTTITGFTKDAYDVTLPSGARAIGAGFEGTLNARAFAELIEESKPTHIVLRTPAIGILRTVVKLRVPTLAMLADSFPARTLRDRMKRLVSAHYLRSRSIERIGNHGRNATQQLVLAGVPPHKVFAWDYPALDTPHAHKAKAGPSGRKLLYVGLLTAEKGVDDLLHALAQARKTVPHLELDLIGEGEMQRLQALARSLDVGDAVRFEGRVANGEIIGRMAAADAVVVPSRHAYPEGLPLTIYEAYCSRTPLIVSDHPMFAGNVEDGISGLTFRSDDAADLASRINALFSDMALYARLSRQSAQAWERIQIADHWGDAIASWLDGAPDASEAPLAATAR